jgi:hypothetical protein
MPRPLQNVIPLSGVVDTQDYANAIVQTVREPLAQSVPTTVMPKRRVDRTML